MEDCPKTIISKVTASMDCLFGSCMPRRYTDESGCSVDGEKDNEYRKEELKQLVGIFASRAQNYIACTRVMLESQSFKKAQYRLDCQLRTLTVDTDGTLVEIPLTEVKAVYGFEDLQLLDNYEPFLRCDVIKGLDEEQRDRLSVIEYTKEGRDAQMVLLEQEVQTSDPFITVLRILKMYTMTGS